MDRTQRMAVGFLLGMLLGALILLGDDGHLYLDARVPWRAVVAGLLPLGLAVVARLMRLPAGWARSLAACLGAAAVLAVWAVAEEAVRRASVDVSEALQASEVAFIRGVGAAAPLPRAGERERPVAWPTARGGETVVALRWVQATASQERAEADRACMWGFQHPLSTAEPDVRVTARHEGPTLDERLPRLSGWAWAGLWVLLVGACALSSRRLLAQLLVGGLATLTWSRVPERADPTLAGRMEIAGTRLIRAQAVASPRQITQCPAPPDAQFAIARTGEVAVDLSVHMGRLRWIVMLFLSGSSVLAGGVGLLVRAVRGRGEQEVDDQTI